MKRLLLALLLVTGSAQAFEWPWDRHQRESYSYCKGFVFAGLAALPVEDLSRIQLWLSWNTVVETEFQRGELVQEQYEAGKARFSSLLDSKDTDALVRLANRQCDFADT
ncbi:MAG: hypothetical protein H6992_04680 [Pseudomonadales bacterium]|nr:hypothetical protein [Pseudomonadales bacterium]